jgi:hypothetical protein
MGWKQYLIVERREIFSLINAKYKVENFSRDHLTHDDNDVVALLFLLQIKMNE